MALFQRGKVYHKFNDCGNKKQAPDFGGLSREIGAPLGRHYFLGKGL